MLTQLEVFNSRITEAPFPIGEGTPAGDPIQVRDIDGLGPVNATVNTSPLGDLDQESYIGSFVGKRAITITVGFNPDWRSQTFATLRQAVYAYFMPKSEVRLRFTSDNLPTVEISGIVESCMPDIFAKQPQMVVTIICPKPNFVDVSATVVTGITVAPGDTATTEINYRGTVTTGFVLNVQKSAGADYSGQIQVINAAPNQEFMIVSGVVIDTNQYLEISTLAGDKHISSLFFDTSIPENMLAGLSPNSVWSRLQKGRNNFQVISTVPGLGWTLRYFNQYGGI